MSSDPQNHDFEFDPTWGDVTPALPIKIQLAEVPAPSPIPPAAPMVPVPPIPPPSTRIELPPLPGYEAVEEPETPSRLAYAKKFLSRGYFDPFHAFGLRVDWKRFSKAQIFLFFLSLLMPFLYLLVMGTATALLYLFGASIASATTSNPVHEAAIYPLVFVLAKGYWIVYLALPLAVFTLGWVWASITAWSLTRDADHRVIDFKKALSILAMLGAMLAPFTLFPFLRLVALGVLIWYMFKRMHETFHTPWSLLLKRGGVSLLACTLAYSWFERKAESYSSAGTELTANLDAFYRKGKKLEWPAFREKAPPQACQALWEELGNFDPVAREQASAKALVILKGGFETPTTRRRLAQQMATMGNAEGMAFVSRYYQSGTGTAVNLPAALEWVHKASLANPKQLDIGLEEAKLLMLNQRVLEGKRRFVALGKDNMQVLYKITDFIQKAGFGKFDTSCQHDVQNLYAYGPTSWGSDYDYPRDNGRDYQRRGRPFLTGDRLAVKLAAVDIDGSQWFYRALVEEYGKTAPAGPEIYGELTAASQEEERARKIASGDPVALDVEGDKMYNAGDTARARDLWLKAALALNNDDRDVNATFYMKLAESYDPATAKMDPDTHKALKYYFGYLLLTKAQEKPSPRVVEALKRLGVPSNQDVQSQPFLDQCMRYELPEAWATMGGYYMDGVSQGVPVNHAKARECFLKALSFGYKGPLVYKFLANLDPANAPKWKALAQKA